MQAAVPDRLLIVDDDPVCRRFAGDVLEAAGYEVAACGTIAAARSALAAGAFACLLCDLGLPDGSGLELLASAAAARIPLVVMSAELPPALRDVLLRRGVHAALQKPMRAADLLDTVAAASSGGHTNAAARPTVPSDALLDDDKALEAAGSTEFVAGLRALLREELPLQRAETLAALERGDPDAARSVLHRLRAACGFCGAARLQRDAARLADALLAVIAHDEACAQFVDTLDATLAALDARESAPS